MDLAGASLDKDITVFADSTSLLSESFEGSGIGHGLKLLSNFCHCFDSGKGGGVAE